MSAAVLFDVDGTLIDSTYLHAVAWWQALRRAGFDVPMARLHRAIGMGADQLVPHVLPGSDEGGDPPDDDLVADLGNAHDAIYATYWPALRPFDAAAELVRRCHDAGLTTVLASSAGDDEVAVTRQVLGCDDWIDHTTSSTDGEQSKPAPDLVQIAVQRSGADASDVVFLGDAVWDVRACLRAGVRCIGFECGGTGAAELRDAGAVEVWAGPAELLRNWDDSLLARLAGHLAA